VGDEAEEAHFLAQAGLFDGPSQGAVAADVLAQQNQAEIVVPAWARTRAKARISRSRFLCGFTLPAKSTKRPRIW